MTAEPATAGMMTAEEIARYVVAEAIWAPSVHNTQPWRFVADGQQVSLYADTDRGLPAADPDGREMMISCGAALFNLRLALRSLGYVPETRVLPDPRQPMLAALVSWRKRCPASEYERWLSDRVRRRRTHRGAFDPEPLPYGTLAALRGSAARDGALLRVVADEGGRATLAAAVETAERYLRLDAQRVCELARWSPPPGSARSDGVPATSYPARPERTDPHFPGRDFAHGYGWGMPPLSSARWPRATGVVGLLTTAADRQVDWVNAGQALQRILLTASASGVAVALHSQPTELPWLREFIRAKLCDNAYPHLVLRIGMVIQAAISVRRDLDEVLFLSIGRLPGVEKARTMKLITAIIRPDKLDELIQVVLENGGHGLTATEVRGFGRQFGEPAVRTVNADLGDLGLPANRTAALLPKVRLDILVLDENAETMMEAIAKHARTETIGDGKIWVSTVDSVMRVRTGERDRHAV